MDITYLGHSSFKIKGKNASVVTDPFDPKMVGFKYSGVEADIVTISHNHNDHNQTQLVSGARKIIEGPGEYEVSEISIIGIDSFHDDKEGTLRGKNTIYVFEIDGLRLSHLGDLGEKLDEKKVESIGHIDVLMIPVGGEFTIGPKEAIEAVQAIDPYFIIPMHYRAEGLSPQLAGKLLPVETFLSEAGMPAENLPKFSLKKEDILEGQNPKIIVLERR